MKHKIFLLALLLFTIHDSRLTTPAQTITGTVPIKWVSALPTTCVTTRRERVLVYKYTATTGIYFCSGTNTWTQLDQTATSALTLTQGTITSSTPFVNHTATWNNSAGTFVNFKSNVTDTDSAAASLLADFQVGGTSRFKIGKTGNTTITQGTLTTTVTPWLNHTATWNDAGTTHQGILSNVTNTNSAAASTLIDLQVGGTSQFKVTRAGIATTAGAIELGHASDTTLARSAAGVVTIEGDQVAKNLVSYLASTVTYNNAAALADTALSVNVAASGIYEIELTAHQGAGVSRGLNMDFGGTATATNFIGTWTAYNTPIDTTVPTVGAGFRTTAAGTDTSTVFVLLNNVYYQFRGTIEVNGAGTFLLRAAQESAHASDTTLLRGSVLKLTKLN